MNHHPHQLALTIIYFITIVLTIAAVRVSFKLGRSRENLRLWELKCFLNEHTDLYSITLNEFMNIVRQGGHYLSTEELRKFPWIDSLVTNRLGSGDGFESIRGHLASIRSNWEKNASGTVSFDEFLAAVCKTYCRDDCKSCFSTMLILRELDFQLERRERESFVASNREIIS